MSYMKAMHFDVEEDYHNNVPLQTAVEHLMSRFDLPEDYARQTVRRIWDNLDREMGYFGCDPY